MIWVLRTSVGDGSGRKERIIGGAGLHGFLMILSGETDFDERGPSKGPVEELVVPARRVREIVT
jgi:hypothetical protein